jgi:WD40 repeat protein
MANMRWHCLILIIAAATALRAQEIEGSAPLPPDVPMRALPMPGVPVPTKPAGEPGGITGAIRKAIGLGAGTPKPIPLTPQQRAEIDQAVHDLASDDFHTRESAAVRLIEIGQPALAALEGAGKSADAEVRFRAQQLFTIVQSKVLTDSRILSAHEDIVWTVAYSNSGRLLASGGGGKHDNGQWSAGSDFAIRVWDVSSGKVRRTIEGHTSTVNRLVWSADDSLLLAASSDGTARIWRASNGAEYRIFRGHEGSVTHALFTPDERQVVTAGWDKTVRIWDVHTGKEQRKIDWPHGRVWGLALSPDGKFLALCGDSPIIRVLNFADGKQVCDMGGGAGSVVTLAFSPDSTQLASGDWDNSARIWHITDRTKGVRRMTDATGRVEGLAWSADGRHLVTTSLDNKVRVYDAAQGTLVRTYEGHTGGIAKVSVSPLGDAIATGGWDGDIRIWPTTGIK